MRWVYMRRRRRTLIKKDCLIHSYLSLSISLSLFISFSLSIYLYLSLSLSLSLFLCLSNGLMMNANKTQCIFIGSRQLLSKIPSNITLHFSNTNITPDIHVKNLGLYMDRYLTFDKYINETNKKVMDILMFINRIKKLFRQKTRTIIVGTISCVEHFKLLYCDMGHCKHNSTNKRTETTKFYCQSC